MPIWTTTAAWLRFMSRAAACLLTWTTAGPYPSRSLLRPSHDMLFQPLMEGLVLINDKTEQIDNGIENATDEQTMAFYNQNEIPFYKFFSTTI
jgi:hypothetical protein